MLNYEVVEVFRQLIWELKISLWELKMRCGNVKIEERTSPKELWALDSEAPEVSGTPRGDQGSLKEGSRSSKVTILGTCRVVMSLQGAAGSPQRAPKGASREPK